MGFEKASGVWLKSEDAQGHAFFTRQGFCQSQQSLVATVQPVKISNGHDSTAQCSVNRLMVIEEFHFWWNWRSHGYKSSGLKSLPAEVMNSQQDVCGWHQLLDMGFFRGHIFDMVAHAA